MLEKRLLRNWVLKMVSTRKADCTNGFNGLNEFLNIFYFTVQLVCFHLLYYVLKLLLVGATTPRKSLRTKVRKCGQTFRKTQFVRKH